MIDEFGPKIQYMKGSNNLVADARSCLPRLLSCPTEELFAATQYDPLDDFLVKFAIISKYQLEDSNPDKFDSQMMHHSTLVFQANSERKVIPVGLQHCIIKFYHDSLKHPGVT
jgi:hypothetical protein